MRFSSFAYACSAILSLNSLVALASPLLDKRADGVSQVIFDDLVRYTKYSSAVYQWICPKPLGNNLVQKFNKGFVVRDDQRKEIVLAFRGTADPVDVLVDLHIILKPLQSPGINDVGDARVHSGFLSAYNLVANDVLSIVKGQVAAYPKYSLVVTGHSLGGAIASIAALSIRGSYPSLPIKLYTYGQPRTGNPAFASLVESRIGTENIFRAVHTDDSVPRVPLKPGYRHFATEYWNFRDPAVPANVRKCSGGEDPKCSDSVLLLGNIISHPLYFGEVMSLNPSLCG